MTHVTVCKAGADHGGSLDVGDAPLIARYTAGLIRLVSARNDRVIGTDVAIAGQRDSVTCQVEGPWLNWLEHRSPKPEVVGSIPTGPANLHERTPNKGPKDHV